MKAAVLRTLGQLEIEDVALDGPREGEVRLRVLASGLCHSDYLIITGAFPIPLPAVLGHEVAGVIEAVGPDVPGLTPGDFVVTSASAYCGHCRECQRGQNHRCDERPGRPNRPAGSRLTRNGEPLYQLANLGGFAEEMVVHHRAVVKISDAVPPASAALLGCAVLTGVGAVINCAKVEPGASVAVIGCGGVGLNVVQGSRIAGAGRIIAIDRTPAKLEIARAFGATDTMLAGPDSTAAILELTGGGVDYAFEVVGLSATARDAVDMLRKGGTAILVGVATAGAELSIPITPFGLSEKRIVGSLMGSSPFQLFLPQLADYYLRGLLKLDELVSDRIPLEAINAGYARLAEGAVTRSVLIF